MSMMDAFLRDLDPAAKDLYFRFISMVDVESINFGRTSKNPETAYQSDSVTVSINTVPNVEFTSRASLPDITMAVTFLQEASLLISLLTTGVIHSAVYKARKHNLIERFNRMTAVIEGIDRPHIPFQKAGAVDVD